jgi:thiol:disulfide interchange protein
MNISSKEAKRRFSAAPKSGWRMLAIGELEPMRLSKLPLVLLLTVALAAHAAGKKIFPDPSQARADVAAALRQAAAEHKRVLLDFGGDWCPDCQVLDIYLHDAQNLPLLEKSFVVVHVNIGHVDANLDLAQQYGVPLNKGVPALAVLDAHGRALYSQQNGEFKAMRRMQSSDVTKFLMKWKP